MEGKIDEFLHTQFNLSSSQNALGNADAKLYISPLVYLHQEMTSNSVHIKEYFLNLNYPRKGEKLI